MKKNVFLVSLFLLAGMIVNAQEPTGGWTLRSCIDYAIKNNIQVKRTQINYNDAEQNVIAAKGQYQPSLSFSSSQNFSHRMANGSDNNSSYTGSYGLNAGWTVYNGGVRELNLQSSRLSLDLSAFSIEQAQNSIELQIIQVYLQLLYSNETVKINEANLKLSTAQYERAKALLEAGSISRSDFAQIESQFSSDKYQLVVAESNLANIKLQLKQLLELNINDEINLAFPSIEEGEVLMPLPKKNEVFEIALETLPEMKSSDLNIASAELSAKVAKAAYLPTISLNASLSTGNMSGMSTSFGRQLSDNFSQGAGLSLSLPILNRQQTRTNVAKAKLQITDAELAKIGTEKNILQAVENVYLNAVSSQNSYRAAKDKLKSAETSFELLSEQFNLGMKNTLELLTGQTNLLKAQQEILQAKYMSLLNIQLLNFYQNKPIGLD